MQTLMTFASIVSCLLAGYTVTALPLADIGEFPTQMQYDSYAVIPKVGDDPGETELNLEIVPPAPGLISSGPQLYYMTSDGFAEPVEAVEAQRRIQRKREAIPDAGDESLLTAETVIIGPPSGQSPFGTPAVNLGFRPARAYYARRYHKYPWNYH